MDEQVAPVVESGLTGYTPASEDGVAPAVERGSTKSLTNGVPWGIKSIEPQDRDAALAASRRAGQRVGEWLGEAIRAKIAAEREPAAGYDVLAPSDVLMPPGRPVTADELRIMLALGVELQNRMGWRRFPTRVGRAIHRAMMLRLGAEL